MRFKVGRNNFFFLFLTCLIIQNFIYINCLKENSSRLNPNQFDLFLFPDSTGTKCLDGTPYGVYYSSGYGSGENNILLSFWGGGWCSGRDKAGFLSDCVERSKSLLGSSLNWDRSVGHEDEFLGGNAEKNINFYNWHRFDVPYCDGAGHQGHVTDFIEHHGTKLYFRGHKNTLTALEFIFEKVKIESLQKIVVTGCSAGGLATFYWIQYIADFIKAKNPVAEVFGIPDSGFFVDYENLRTKDDDYKLKQQILFDIVNAEVLPEGKECLEDNLNEKYNCLLAEKIFKYIKVPLLMLQPGYDTWQLYNILGEDCVVNDSLSSCDENHKVISHQYKNYQIKLIEDELKINKKISVWSPSCLRHCYNQEQQSSLNWTVPENSGNTINEVVKSFIIQKGKNQITLIDELDWPNNSKCANKIQELLMLK